MKRFAVVMLVLMVCACSRPEPTPRGTQSQAVPERNAPGKAATSFPAVDLSCKSADDCDTHLCYLTDDDRCCWSCTYRVGSKKWVKAVEAVCQTRSHEGCPTKKCAGPPELRCVDGKCVGKK